MSATAARHRPAGVSLISILVIIAGVLDIIVGIVSIWNRGDASLLVEMKATKSEMLWFGILVLVVGVIAVLVGLAFWKGSNAARVLIGIVLLLRLIGTVWAFVSFDKSHWYEGIGSVIIYALVTWYVLAGQSAKDYTHTT